MRRLWQVKYGEATEKVLVLAAELSEKVCCFVCVCVFFFFLENIRGVFAQSETESEQGHVGAVQWSAPCLCVCLAEDAEMCLSFT